MIILSVYYTHKPGGLCLRLYRLLSALAERGHQVYYLSLDQPPAFLSPSIRFIRIPFPLSARSGILFWILFSVWGSSFALIKSLALRADRLVVFNPYYATTCYLAGLLSGAKIVLFVRASLSEIAEVTNQSYFAKGASKIFEILGIKNADKVIAMTPSMGARLGKYIHKSSSLQILPNDLPRIEKSSKENARLQLATLIGHNIGSDDFVIATLGVLDKRKNVEIVLRALLLLTGRECAKRIHFVIFGAGAWIKELEHFVKDLKLERVYFCGWQERPWDMLQGADVYMHPSLHEGMSNAVLEAFALEVPVLLSDIPEHRDLVGEQKTLLFSPNDPAFLADKLERLSARDNADYRELAQQIKDVRGPLDFDWADRAVSVVLT